MNSYDNEVQDTAEYGTEKQVLEPLNEFPLTASLIIDRSLQTAAFRRRRSAFNELSVHPADVDDVIAKGWIVSRPGQRTVRMKQPKPHHQLLEDRAWSLLYQMGYAELSEDVFVIRFRRETGTIGSKQIDAFAYDQETAVIIECKSRSERGRRSLQKDIGETAALQNYIRKSIYDNFDGHTKPKLIWLYITSNIIWSEPDIERARDCGIYVITDNDLNYFEVFLKHMGPAGRYQILREFLKGQKIPAMAGTKIPAIRGTLGGQNSMHL